MAASSPSPAVLRDEIQSTIQHEVQELHTDLQNVQTNLQKMRSELIPDIKRLINRSRGNTMPLEIVPFNNGDDPTQPPHNLRPLLSIDDIEVLDEQQVKSYLIGYGIKPTAEDSSATDVLRRNYIITLIGAAKL